MHKRILIVGGVSFAAFLLITGMFAAKLFLHHLAVKKGVGPQHIFQLSEKPERLTEELALVKAREALSLDGDDPANWHPVQDPRSYLVSQGYELASLFDPSTPEDGRTHEFLALETKRPSCGIVIFGGDHGALRFVRVGLSGSNVLCQCTAGR
jgi:hypothetical protein